MVAYSKKGPKNTVILNNIQFCEGSRALHLNPTGFFSASWRIRMTLVVLLFIFLSRLLFLNPSPVLFDAPEYTQLTNQPFFDALVGGHKPNHPGYMVLYWVISRMIGVTGFSNAYLVGAFLSWLSVLVSSILIYTIVSKLIDSKTGIKSCVLFLLFPIVSLLGTTASVEPVALVFFLSAVYFLKRYLQKPNHQLFLLSIAALSYTFLIHGQFVLWIPALFSLLFFKNFNSKHIGSLFKIVGSSLIGYICITLILFLLSHTASLYTYLGFGNQGMSHWYRVPWGTLRYMRNVIIVLLRDYSSGAVLFCLFIIWCLGMKKKNWKKVCVLSLLWVIPALLALSLYAVDFPGRRSLPLAVGISVFLAITIKKRSVFIILCIYLFLITLPILYAGSVFQMNSHPNVLRNSMEMKVPHNSLYIYSHYYHPTVVFSGKTYSMGGPGNSKENLKQLIDHYLLNNNPVYIESGAVYDPYEFYTGQTLNTLSLGKFGVSDAKWIFGDYTVSLAYIGDAEKRVYLYQITNNRQQITINKDQLQCHPDPPNRRGRIPTKPQKPYGILRGRHLRMTNLCLLVSGKAEAGKAVLVYSNRLRDRILNARTDYFDPITWVWVLITNKHEPIAWTYADRDGNFEVPVFTSDIKVVGAKSYIIRQYSEL